MMIQARQMIYFTWPFQDNDFVVKLAVFFSSFCPCVFQYLVFGKKTTTAPTPTAEKNFWQWNEECLPLNFIMLMGFWCWEKKDPIQILDLVGCLMREQKERGSEEKVGSFFRIEIITRKIQFF